MGAYVSKFGDWTKAGLILQALSVNIKPVFEAQLREDGEFILKTIQDHIDNQDLNWTPLSKKTVQLKGGDDTIYVETGFLRDNLKVRKVRAPANGVTFFVGASPWVKTPTGEKLSNVMIWLEYGTDTIPPRPLIRPTWEEVEPVLKDNWRDFMQDLIETGGD